MQPNTFVQNLMEGAKEKSTKIRPAKNKKKDFSCDINRKHVKLSDNIKNIDNYIALTAISL